MAKAIEHYRAAIKIDDTDHNHYNNLGIALAADGTTDEAIANFTRRLNSTSTTATRTTTWG